MKFLDLDTYAKVNQNESQKQTAHTDKNKFTASTIFENPKYDFATEPTLSFKTLSELKAIIDVAPPYSISNLKYCSKRNTEGSKLAFIQD
jgi:hypothetical protein